MSEQTTEQQPSKEEKKKKKTTGEMSFLEHLEELRWHIVRSAVLIVVFAVAAFIAKDFIFNEIIFSPKNPDFWTNRMFAKLADFTGFDSMRINSKPLQLISITMGGQFSTHIWVSLVAGLIVASPFVIYEFWKFISPALYENEKKHARGAVFYMATLFIMGILFGYYLIVPLSTHFFGSYAISNEVANQINITSYISTVTSIVLACGLIFELPMLVFFMSKIGLVTPSFLRKYRRHAYIVLLTLSAIITPPDVFSQILVTVPLAILYEVSIFISRGVERKSQKAAKA